MLRGKVEGEIVLLSEGSSVEESPEDKETSYLHILKQFCE